MSFVPTRAPLADDVVALEPLTLDHVDGMWVAAQTGRETYGLTRVPDSREAMRDYVQGQIDEEARGARLPFATRDRRSGVIVGGTTFMTIERWAWPAGNPNRHDDGMPDALEIGSTWLNPSAQRTAINTHAKFLMLSRAFEEWKVRRVTLKTDERNTQSRSAIARLGAKFDGVLRAHMPAWDGGVRNTAFFSNPRERVARGEGGAREAPLKLRAAGRGAPRAARSRGRRRRGRRRGRAGSRAGSRASRRLRRASPRRASRRGARAGTRR